MGEIRRIDVPVAPDLGDEIAEAIAAGDYPDAAAVVEAALRQWQSDRADRPDGAELRRLWVEGLASGEPRDVTDEWFDDIKTRGKARLAALRAER